MQFFRREPAMVETGKDSRLKASLSYYNQGGIQLYSTRVEPRETNSRPCIWDEGFLFCPVHFKRPTGF